MRCKNCGFENEAERYICQNCGSPLYDEDEDIESQQNGYSDEEPKGDDPNENTDKKNTRNSIIIIAVLAVLLIAIVTGIIIFASQSNKTPEDPSDSTSTTESTEAPASSTTESTTKETTTKPTTASTTEPTTKESTTESTTVAKYLIAVDIDGYGTVTGDGTYKAGEKASLVATANDGSQFVGWYNNATKELVASGATYTVTVQKDLSLTARFETIQQPDSDDQETGSDDSSESDSGED